MAFTASCTRLLTLLLSLGAEDWAVLGGVELVLLPLA